MKLAYGQLAMRGKNFFSLRVSRICAFYLLCRFQLINLRSTFQFRLIVGGLGSNLQAPNFNIVAQSAVIANSIPNQPVQVRKLSLMSCCHSHLCTQLPS